VHSMLKHRDELLLPMRLLVGSGGALSCR
jgi:hypothetical protein